MSLSYPPAEKTREPVRIGAVVRGVLTLLVTVGLDLPEPVIAATIVLVEFIAAKLTRDRVAPWPA